MLYTRMFAALSSCLCLVACSSGLPDPLPELAPSSSTTLRVRLASAGGDAEELRGQTRLNRRALSFGARETVGLRFEGVRLPKGAKITSAHLEFRAAGPGSGPLMLRVRGVNSDHAAAFTGSSHELSTRPLTAATSIWRPLAWRTGQTTRTSSLTGIVQGIVNRSGWRSGNALAFTVTGSGSATRAAISYDGSPAQAATLVVTFHASAGPTPTAPVSGRASQREWHNRLMRTVSNPRYNSALDPKKLAASGDLYKLGRELNMHVTSMILAYRETGDRDIVRHLDQIMNIARKQLGDSNRDGFKNWTYKKKNGDHTTKRYIGTDLIALDEMLTHSMVAAAAYTFKQAGFSSSAKFWTDYLKNDFEAKWRKRSGRSSSYPFVDHFLMHPTTQFIRYNLYMHKLTGQSSYYREAKRLAAAVRGNMRVSGTGYVWNHRVGQKSMCQPITYVKYTTQAMVDVATVDPKLFRPEFMKRVANTMAHKVLKSSSGTSLAADACGNGSLGNLNIFVQHPFAQLARWDGSGKLRTAAERAYAARERNASSPSSANLPATMVFTLGR
jgi:hypothetical protein